MPESIAVPLAADAELMRADAILPDEVRPEAGCAGANTGTVLLTGATGFVGAHLLHTLLCETPADVVCLVRPGRRGAAGDGTDRVRRNLESHALWRPEWAERIRFVDGDLLRPELGWGEQEQARLAERIDAIYHAAATVNWVLPYAGLRAANVLGTLALLRLACRGRAKPFHFLSTLGVCYATATGGRTLAEADDPWPLLGQLHLAYAQSKSVAEQLVVEARRRGLPAVIYRPTLVTGDSRSGAANPDDFLSRGIGACVAMGCAPDADWSIDACPVDHVARAVVRYATATRRGGGDVLHLVHPRPRHWRELVLWMRLRGYPMRLLPYREWLCKLEQTAHGRRHPLYPLLGFFRARVGGVTLPETYMGRYRSPVCDRWTRATLAELDVTCPTLHAGWLERFFASLTAKGILPSLPAAPSRARADQPDVVPALLRTYFDDPTLSVRPAGPAERLSEQSILTELISWRGGAAIGLFRQPLELQSGRRTVPARLDVVVKVKADDQPLLDVVTAAALAEPRLGAACRRWRDRLGLSGGHLREVALYQQRDGRWQRFTPVAYGATWDEERHGGCVVLEDLSPCAWMDPRPGEHAWSPDRIEATVHGLAELQAIWFDRRSELLAQPWLGHVFTAAGMAETVEWWSELARYAARFFVPWLGPDARRLQRRLLARLERWWLPLEQMPHTLIHNDFNPRNIALRHTGAGPRLCAYDWELASSGVPQHDLAQLLCFVLPSDCPRGTVRHYLDLHRAALQAATGRGIPAGDWGRGFGLALADLFVNRLAMYTLVHAVRRQPFLERVMHTWRTLYAYHDPLD